MCDLEGTYFDAGFEDNHSVGIADTFEKNTQGKQSCVAVKYSGTWVRREFTGQAYHYYTDYKNDAVPDCQQSGNGCLALVSSGEDGVLDNNLADTVTNDLVYILRVN